jgi:hypothetical protein
LQLDSARTVTEPSLGTLMVSSYPHLRDLESVLVAVQDRFLQQQPRPVNTVGACLPSQGVDSIGKKLNE